MNKLPLPEEKNVLNKWLKIPLLLAAALAFTVLMTAGGKAAIFCAYLMWPGVAIGGDSLHWLHRPVIGDNLFFPLILTFNTLIYSVVFGLLLWLVQRLRKYSRSHRT